MISASRVSILFFSLAFASNSETKLWCSRRISALSSNRPADSCFCIETWTSYSRRGSKSKTTLVMELRTSSLLSFKTNPLISNKAIWLSRIIQKSSNLTSLNFSCWNSSSKLSGWPPGKVRNKSEKPFWLSTSLLKPSTGFSWLLSTFEVCRVGAETSLNLSWDQDSDPGVGEGWVCSWNPSWPGDPAND